MFVTLSLEIIVQAEGTVAALVTALAEFLVLSWSCPKLCASTCPAVALSASYCLLGTGLLRERSEIISSLAHLISFFVLTQTPPVAGGTDPGGHCGVRERGPSVFLA